MPSWSWCLQYSLGVGGQSGPFWARGLHGVSGAYGNGWSGRVGGSRRRGVQTTQFREPNRTGPVPPRETHSRPGGPNLPPLCRGGLSRIFFEMFQVSKNFRVKSRDFKI